MGAESRRTSAADTAKRTRRSTGRDVRSMGSDPFRPDTGDEWKKWGLHDPEDTERLTRPKDSAGRTARVNVRVGLHLRYLADHLVERPEFPEFKTESDVYRYCIGKVLADFADVLADDDEMLRRKLQASVGWKMEQAARLKASHMQLCKGLVSRIDDADGDKEELTEIVELCLASVNAEKNKRRKSQLEEILRQARRELLL